MLASFIEGLSDSIGFMVGALLGYGLGLTFGLNLFSEGYDTGSIIAILLVGVGGGMGLQASRRWRASRAKNK